MSKSDVLSSREIDEMFSYLKENLDRLSQRQKQLYHGIKNYWLTKDEITLKQCLVIESIIHQLDRVIIQREIEDRDNEQPNLLLN